MAGALASCLSGCAALPDGMTVEALIGTKITDGGFYGPAGPTATIRVRQRLSNGVWCELEHVSHIFAGPPFGPRTDEDSLNQVGCGIRFGADR